MEIGKIKEKLKERGFVEGEDFEIQLFKGGKIFRICFNFCVLAFNYTKEINLVTLLRSCEIFGAKEFITVGVKPEITEKASVGAKKWIEVKHFDNFEDAYKYLKEKGYKLVGVEILKEAKNTFEIKEYPKKCCFIIGSEKEGGLSKEVIEKCDLIVRIPQYGITGSLNTATAGSIIVYDYVLKNIKVDLLEPKERNYRV